MKANVVAFLAGLVFAVGLALAGMTQPSKVVGFLDFFGDWDPSLMMVMVGAIGVHFVLFRLILKRKSPILTDAFQVPTRRDITPELVAGSAIFGVGWGLGGYCPGPGIAAVATLGAPALTFVGAMTVGMLAYGWLENARERRR